MALAAGAFASSTVLLGRFAAQQQRQADRREQRMAVQIEDLTNRAMYLVERPWKLPADLNEPPQPGESYDPDLVFPEQTVIQEP